MTLVLKSNARRLGSAHRAPGSLNSHILRPEEARLIMAVRLLAPAEFALVPPDILSDDTRIPLGLLDAAAHNPRTKLIEIEALAASIDHYTLLQPIVVRRVGGRYELIGGHRRVAAYRLLHERNPRDARWSMIPAVVRRTDDETAGLMGIASQVHCVRWTPREEAAALEILASTRTLREVGELVHKSEGWVSKRLRLYNDSVVSAYVQTGQLVAGVAEELLLTPTIEQRRELAEQACLEAWSASRARSEVRRLKVDGGTRELGQRVQQLEEVLVRLDDSHITAEMAHRLRILQDHIAQLLLGCGAAA